jgi:hypothetical protein
MRPPSGPPSPLGEGSRVRSQATNVPAYSTGRTPTSRQSAAGA